MYKLLTCLLFALITLLASLFSFFKRKAQRLENELKTTNNKLNFKELSIGVLKKFLNKNKDIKEKGKADEEVDNKNITDIFHNFNNGL